MKKTILISAIAVFLSAFNVNAKTVNNPLSTMNSEWASNVSPFCMAIVKGDLTTVKRMIELGADINQKSAGLTPAMYAAKFNKVDILKLLIAEGANLKTRTKAGFTAKKYAEISNADEAKAIIEAALMK